VTHSQEDSLRLRVFGIGQGDEDLNDDGRLWLVLVWQTTEDRSESLASSSTLCRMEQRANRETALAMHQILRE
jgi:hypothetical protein